MTLAASIFNVTVSLDSPAVTRQGFGTPLIIGTNPEFSERIRFYSSPAELLADSAASVDDNDVEYLQAVVLANNGIKRFAIGKVVGGGSPDASWGAAFTAILAESNDFFGVILTSRTEADIDSVAALVTAAGKVLFAQTADADVITSATNDVASELQAASNNNVVLCYHTSTGQYLDAGICAAVLRANPDTTSTTAAAKSLVGVTKDALSTTARGYALAKNCLIYEDVKGLGWTFAGKCVGGAWLDDVIVRYWYKARLEEDLAQMMSTVSNRDSKVPYTPRGFALVEAVYRKRHAAGVAAGHFIDVDENGDPAFTFEAPAAGSSKADRTLAVVAREILSGGVHQIVSTTYLATE